MVVNPVTKYTFEIFEEIEKAKTKQERITLLQSNATPAVKNILVGTFDDAIEWNLPEGTPPYNPADLKSTANSFTRQLDQLRYFVKGGPGDNLPKFKRESMFIRLLENIHPKDAELVLSMVAKKSPAKSLTKALVKEVFPNIIRK